MKKLSIAIPASVVSDIPHLREKTSRIGSIGRAAAIFKVDMIIIYPDNPRVDQKGDIGLIVKLLSYMETPQYLRKRLFELSPDLQFAGILPPLRTPHHPLNRNSRNIKIGEYREGVALSKARQGILVDIGVEQPALIKNAEIRLGKRVTVKVVKTGQPIEAELADRKDVPIYWGYTVTTERRSLGRMLEGGDFDVTIATSKFGSPFAGLKERLIEKLMSVDSVLLVFGAPTVGLNEIAAREGLELNKIADFVVNMIPCQGTETVRTEEAVLASLAVFNVCIDVKEREKGCS
jgi:predicted SPOUT superfamily RNA methylase MTH1